jgi:hypothetical protein
MSSNSPLITKRYDASYTSVPAGSVILLGTVDLASHSTVTSEYTENLVKIEFSWAQDIAPTYLSAELHVLIEPNQNQFIPSALNAGNCGQQGNYTIVNPADKNLYSHLLHPDNANVRNFFEIFFGAFQPHTSLSDYYEIQIFAVTPNYTGHCGAVITTYYPSNITANHDY